MTITRVGVFGDEIDGGNLVPVLPSVSDGDAAIIAAFCSSARSFTTPTGIANTPVLVSGFPVTASGGKVYLWRVKLTAADSGNTLTIGQDASNKVTCVGVVAHSSVGFDDDFIDQVLFEANAVDTTFTAPQRTAGSVGCYPLHIFGVRATSPLEWPVLAGITRRESRFNAGTGATSLALYDDDLLGGIGSTFGPQNATNVSSDNGGGLTLLIKEQTAATAPTEFLRVIPIVAATTGGGGGPSPLLVPDAGAWFGVMDNFEPLEAYESRVGRLVEIQQFHQWTDNFPTNAEKAYCDVGGRIVMFNWKGTPGWASIASGAQDAVIDACAARFVAWGKRCFMAFHHEPEENVTGFGTGSSGTPAEYRAAWRRVVERFRAAGATNVIWVWKMVGGQFTPIGTQAYNFAGTGNSLWPGEDVIDWLAWDPYNLYGCTTNTWHSFEQRADQSLIGNFSFYDHTGLNMPGKPLMIGETGTNEHDNLTPTKAQWFLDMLTSMKTNLTRIRAMYYFHAGPPTFCERYIHTSPEAQAAMAQVGADPYFNPARPTF